LCSRNLASREEAAKKLKELGVKADIEVVQLDVTNGQQIEAAVEHVKSNHGKLDGEPPPPSLRSGHILTNLVLISNAGIAKTGPQPYKNTHDSLGELRQHYTEVLSTNLTSVAAITAAFLPLLHASKSPKVINITSGLSSMTRMLKMEILRATVYGSSKVGLNGLTVHMQIAENDWAGKEGVEMIKYYTVEPGLLKTAFTNYKEGTRDPKEGAEVVTQLVLDDEGKYPGGTYWQFEEGEMREVAW
jgi:NAD(P)-dependent dehydrogenase (short-subunit alcohol dehydrogenase family)